MEVAGGGWRGLLNEQGLELSLCFLDRHDVQR